MYTTETGRAVQGHILESLVDAISQDEKQPRQQGKHPFGSEMYQEMFSNSLMRIISTNTLGQAILFLTHILMNPNLHLICCEWKFLQHEAQSLWYQNYSSPEL